MKLIDEFGNYKGVYIILKAERVNCPPFVHVQKNGMTSFFYIYIVYIKSAYRRLVLRQMHTKQSELLNEKCQCTFIYST